jgi:Polyketide cyclase / dehydrase and lipid transport
MRTLLQRTFMVNASLSEAWDYLVQIEAWPEWAPHILQAELLPPGELTALSRGRLHLRVGGISEFQVSEFVNQQRWKWEGPFLWLTITYDHLFEPLNDHQTRLIWTVAAQGPGVNLFGRLFAWIYNQNLNRAIPHLVAHLEQ